MSFNGDMVITKRAADGKIMEPEPECRIIDELKPEAINVIEKNSNY